MPRRVRLDAELVRRRLARSREQAADLIAAGRVTVGGVPATKPATAVSTDAAVSVAEASGPEYASRGGHKLAGALETFGQPSPLRHRTLTVSGRRALDAGASTGGFTDVLLRAGAVAVVAVDVGYGQLAWELRSDPRVVVLDRTNVKDLRPEALPYAPDLVVGDLSFISLVKVLPALVGVAESEADLVLLVKPQFEVGRERLARGGVVRDPHQRVETVLQVADAAAAAGLGVWDVCASPLPGPSGNVEYLVWFGREAPPVVPDSVRSVVADGPQ